MKRYVVLLIACLVLAACKERVKVDAPEEKSPVKTVQRVDTPLRDHGYSNLSTVVLASESSRSEFLNSLESQDGWEFRDTFISLLRSCSVDFATQNILLYAHRESSGSNRVEVAEPVLHGKIVRITVDRIVPAVGTMDMAYYLFVYVADKTVDKFEFDIAGSVISVGNAE